MHQIDPGRGRFRQYGMSKCRTLFGEPSIVISWGRIGRLQRVRVESFVTPAHRAKRWQKLVARRAAHGYKFR